MERGQVGTLERLPSFNLESHHDFCTGFRAWMFAKASPVLRERIADVMASQGLSVSDPAPERRISDIVGKDPLVALHTRCSMSIQQMTWRRLANEFDAPNNDHLKELDRASRLGPGSLELNSALVIPDYAKYEIHQQPGGYVGSDAAGYIYHHGTNSFYCGVNDQDEIHRLLATNVQAPADTVVKRVVELGCGIGQLTLWLSKRFPDAETVGIDVSAPMLRYAHRRAVALDAEIVFRQALAEDTGLASGSVDLIASYLLFHEVPHLAARAIVAEAFRALRPGGIFQVYDFKANNNAVPPFVQYAREIDQTVNQEVWSSHYHGNDLLAVLRDTGFNVEDMGSQHGIVFGYRATKS